MDYNPGAGQEPPPVLGSFMNEEGQRRSARVAALIDTMAGKTEGDFTEAEHKAVLAVLKGTAGGRKMRGGEDEVTDELVVFLTPHVEKAIAYVKSKVSPIGSMTGRVGAVGLSTVDSLVDATSATVVLAAAAVGGTIGTVGAAIRNYVAFANKKAESLMDSARQQAVADKASENITLTLAATMLAANTAGILPLTTILAGALWGAGVATTDASRAAVISGFYQWYLTLDEKDQASVVESAKAYGQAARTGAGDVAGTAAAVASSIANANKKAAAANKLPADASAIITPDALKKGVKGASDPVVTGAIATQLLAVAAPPSVSGTEVKPPGTRALTTREKAAIATAKSASERSAKYGLVGTASSVAAPGPIGRVTRSRARMGAIPGAMSTAGPPTVPAEAASDVPTVGGRRKHKTRSKKSKRRVTRRRARVTMPTFAY